MTRMPNLARRTQAALYVRLGRMEEARAAIDELLRNDPNYSIALQRHSLSGKFRESTAADRFLDDLYKAGLPDQ